MIKIWYKNGNGYSIAFDYDAEKVELLKAKIPHTFRRWDADKKEWWISDDYLYVIDELFKGFTEMVKSQTKMF